MYKQNINLHGNNMLNTGGKVHCIFGFHNDKQVINSFSSYLNNSPDSFISTTKTGLSCLYDEMTAAERR